jgi:hypothetical protein
MTNDFGSRYLVLIGAVSSAISFFLIFATSTKMFNFSDRETLRSHKNTFQDHDLIAEHQIYLCVYTRSGELNATETSITYAQHTYIATFYN